MQSTSLNDFTKDLGNPSIQKVLMILAIYETLSVSKLQEFSELSESQLHLILSRMINLNLLKKQARGIYSLSKDPFMDKLKDAYKTKIIAFISAELDEIQILLKNNLYEKALTRYKDLVMRYEPILQTYFIFKMNALSHDFMDRQKG